MIALRDAAAAAALVGKAASEWAAWEKEGRSRVCVCIRDFPSRWRGSTLYILCDAMFWNVDTLGSVCMARCRWIMRRGKEVHRLTDAVYNAMFMVSAVCVEGHLVCFLLIRWMNGCARLSLAREVRDMASWWLAACLCIDSRCIALHYWKSNSFQALSFLNIEFVKLRIVSSAAAAAFLRVFIFYSLYYQPKRCLSLLKFLICMRWLTFRYVTTHAVINLRESDYIKDNENIHV